MNQPTKKEEIFDKKKIVGAVIGGVVGVVAVAAGTVAAIHFINQPASEPTATETATTTAEPEPTVPDKISLQNTVDKWVDTQSSAGNSGIIIYDIDNDEIVARHNEDTKIRIESIYKMFVAYEGYYRIDSGQWDGNQQVLNWNDFSGKPYTLSLCLDHMIRFSYSSCAEKVWSMIGQNNLQAAYEEKGYKNTSISNITSTPSDLMKLYQQYWKHTDLSEESWKKIQDSMLNQTAPGNAADVYTRNWRQGLPSGFSTAVVYDKVGWLGDGAGHWLYYGDAAFVVFPEVESNREGEKKLARHYIVIALTKNTDYKELVKLGRNLETAVKSEDNYE
ncbi:serine hydrolase [Candidatus Saccharibacteria bacterium]|nr:serine hydrolase [Candidatus Saccharibacteria bacterium]